MNGMAERSDLDTHAHVQLAVDGDGHSLAWLVERLTPLLLAQARVRIGKQLRVVIDAQDLVQEVWSIALPRMASLREREDLDASMMVAFLARILIYRCNDLVRKHIVGKPRAAGASQGMLAGLPVQQSGAVTRAVRRETQDAVRDAIDRLEDLDREIVVMRGIERHPVGQIAAVVGLTENAVSQRYGRALAKLKGLLPRDLADLFAAS